MATKDSLLTLITDPGGLLDDNTTGQISASDVQTVFSSVIDTIFNPVVTDSQSNSSILGQKVTRNTEVGPGPSLGVYTEYELEAESGVLHTGSQIETVVKTSGATPSFDVVIRNNIAGVLTNSFRVSDTSTTISHNSGGSTTLLVKPESVTGQSSTVEVRGSKNFPVASGDLLSKYILTNYDSDVDTVVPMAEFFAESSESDTSISNPNIGIKYRTSNSLVDGLIFNNGNLNIYTNTIVNSTLKVTSGDSGDSILTIESDVSNIVESNNPILRLVQDAQLVEGFVRLEGDASHSAIGSSGNALLLEAKGGSIQFVTGGNAVGQPGGATTGTVAMTINSSGIVTFANPISSSIDSIEVTAGSDSTSFPLFVDSATGTLNPRTHSTFTYDAVAGSLSIEGTLVATRKDFRIPHPNPEKSGSHWLFHSSLEGPEASVFYSGTLVNEDTIKLPDYWEFLVDENTIRVIVTAVGSKQSIYVKEKGVKSIKLGTTILNKIHCDYIVLAERKDINKISVEVAKETYNAK